MEEKRSSGDSINKGEPSQRKNHINHFFLKGKRKLEWLSFQKMEGKGVPFPA